MKSDGLSAGPAASDHRLGKPSFPKLLDAACGFRWILDLMPSKIVVFTGSGLSAESGLPTFRDSKGLWNNYTWQEVASPEGWSLRPEAVLAFYNERRQKAWNALPNAAHSAIADLESSYDVVVITQNVDNLHERAGSSKVIHLHGQLAYARGTSDNPKRYRIDDAPILLGHLCEDGTQLRPDVVWFGEKSQHMDEARWHVSNAAKVLVVGTSLTVQPAASLINVACAKADKVIVSLEMGHIPYDFSYLQGAATAVVPDLVRKWIACAASEAGNPLDSTPPLASQETRAGR
jgi:NAD-dependent deacetylase